ncbi:hypothetical protein pipiens_001951 [Culex pipiens pipiens]|uniref:Peptidase S1 domain-containing protein n=3 Tax=Culex pipiens TaxID=7175 RepID=A0ABD1DSY0_CULPP
MFMKSLVLTIAACIAVALATPVEKNQRIFNGELAEAGQFPYAVGLIVPAGICGGSLVSPNYVLTAAQCIAGIASATVIISSLRIFDVEDPGQIRLEATQFLVHPGYEIAPGIFDVALIRLPQAVTSVRPIRLPNLRQVESTFVGQQATIVGWGSMGQGAAQSSYLRFARSPVITTLSCRTGLPTQQITDQHICTNSEQNSPCQGDNGGPLTITDADGITTQIGMFSFNSILGCESNRPAVYTRMSSYLNWIGDNSDVEIRDNFD